MPDEGCTMWQDVWIVLLYLTAIAVLWKLSRRKNAPEDDTRLYKSMGILFTCVLVGYVAFMGLLAVGWSPISIRIG